ncbi:MULTISPECIES: hypothetical protein [unclassified Sinorhizobium]|uniref:hypothetical protein n=1 Tax=unclassified Sinorhizobium TaxID=2613772 RepID=UPI0024C35A91|nr:MULTISPECIES: hypothetical protein [unclassified Sinorhizobium]MDK1378101.1 hypothetical protein [Sinorhizobium sp. 6-70]MDK1482901.1 hypothetical protein [Sinorhizobium sp. 6-117]
MGATSRPRTTGLRQFLDREQQRDWIAGKIDLPDTGDRLESLEQRFKYVARFEKLLSRPQAAEVLEILRLYGPNCIPMLRKTERYYWSVSCLPSTSDKPLVRVNASWMELFTLYAQVEDIRARFIVHLSDFTTDRSATPSRVDEPFLEQSVAMPEHVSYFFPHGADIFGINVRGSVSIRKFLTSRRVVSAIRTFNLTHMNRGKNAYQASHCYSVADYMQAD